MSDEICADCGGVDVEWMRHCKKHGTAYCRGCSCPDCDEEDYDPTPWCHCCGAMDQKDCDCPPFADNH